MERACTLRYAATSCASVLLSLQASTPRVLANSSNASSLHQPTGAAVDNSSFSSPTALVQLLAPEASAPTNNSHSSNLNQPDIDSASALALACPSADALFNVSASCAEASDWVPLVTAPMSLPAEVGILCRKATRYRVCMANASWCFELPQPFWPPPAPQRIPPFAGRVLLKLRPPLQPPLEASAARLLQGIASQLNFAKNRFWTVETSITGAFLLLDVHALDTYNDHEVAILGPKVADVIRLIAERAYAPSGFVTGEHLLDPQWGVWQLPLDDVQPAWRVQLQIKPTQSSSGLAALVRGLVAVSLLCTACCVCAPYELWPRGESRAPSGKIMRVATYDSDGLDSDVGIEIGRPDGIADLRFR